MSYPLTPPTAFNERDPATWEEHLLPDGYEWREFDADNGEWHLYDADGRDVTLAHDEERRAS